MRSQPVEAERRPSQKGVRVGTILSWTRRSRASLFAVSRGPKRTTHQDELEQRRLIHLDEIGVEVLLLVVGVGLGVELAVLDHLGQDLRGDVGKGNGRVRAGICDAKRARIISVGSEATSREVVEATRRGWTRRRRNPRRGRRNDDVPSIMFLMVSDLLRDVVGGAGQHGRRGSGSSRSNVDR